MIKLRYLLNCISAFVVALALFTQPTAHAVVKERAYTFDDAGAVAGQQPAVLAGFNRRGVVDSAASTTDYGGVDPPSNVNNSLVPLVGSGNVARIPFYAAAADRPGALASNLGLLFDGVDDSLYNPTPPAAAASPYLFDPRDFGQFDVLSQAWVKPTSASFGARQFVWRIGNENGGAIITDTGKWALRTGNESAEVPLADIESVSNITATLNQWSHVAVFRGGNFSFLYVNGSIAAMDPGFWGQDGPEVRLAADVLAGSGFFKGIVDNFNIGTATDGFDPATDLDYYTDQNITFTGIAGDIDQDGDADQADYNIWSLNAGFDNGFGVGDPGTLLDGDADQSGVIDLFDFRVISRAAAAAGIELVLNVPEPSSISLVLAGLAVASCMRRRRKRAMSTCALLVAGVAVLGGSTPARAVVVAADDFLYDGPTKLLHIGGGFNGYQQYAGGQNGPGGGWTDLWGQIGDGVVTTPDYTPPIDPFDDMPEPVAPPNVALYDGAFGVQSELFRDFELAPSVASSSTLYFGGRFKADLEIGTDNGAFTQFYAPRLFLNRVFGDDRYFDINGIALPTQRDRTQDIALGFESFKNINTSMVENMVVARLGAGLEVKAPVTSMPPNDGNWHVIVGKLELNAAGANERLTVWINPTGVETGGVVAQTEADVLTNFSGLIGTLHSQGTRPLNTAGNPSFPIEPVDSQIENPAELGRSYIDDMAIGTAWQDVAQVAVPRLTLRINPTSGAAKLVNATSVSFELDGYSVESELARLNPTGWTSLDDANLGSWLENRATSTQLIESFFNGATTIAPGGQLSLGTLFLPGGAQDLTGRFSTHDGLINLFNVQFTVGGPSVGDFNGDGSTTGADFLVWQRTLGSNVTPGTGADGDNNGIVGAGDLAVWRSNFGQSSVAAAQGVPEPSAIAISAACIAAALGRPVRRRTISPLSSRFELTGPTPSLESL
jgi:hypothetical protein